MAAREELGRRVIPRTFQEARDRHARYRAEAQAMRQKLARRPGGLPAALDALRFETLTPSMGRAFEPALERYHRVLASGVLPAELVPIQDFREALGTKNDDALLPQVIGPYRYFSIAVTDRDAGMIGAIGACVFCHRSGAATVHSSYYVLVPAFRGFGIGRRMLQSVGRLALGFIRSARPGALAGDTAFNLIETNDVATMTLGDRLLDEAIAFHPLDRDRLWQACGFAEIPGIDYHQRAAPPIPLALQVAAVGGDGGVTGCEAVPGQVVLAHVSAFDSLLLNFEEAIRAARQGRALPDPVGEGLIAPIDPGAMLRTRTPREIASRLDRLTRLDRALAAMPTAELPLGARLIELVRDNDGR